MVGEERKYVQLEIFRKTVRGKMESGGMVAYEMTVRDVALTDEEEEVKGDG